jgi:phosphoribosylcarboxyaminoimidazole (NCAIR) mutase
MFTNAFLKCFTKYSLFSGLGIPTVFIAIAGRSNGLGPVLAGNSTWPIINAPPLSPEWAAEDVWSSLRLPSGKNSYGTQTCKNLSFHSPCH